MSAIHDESNNMISKFVRVTKQVLPRKIVSSLLDGSDIVQIIGTAPARLSLELIVDQNGREALDTIDAAGELITVTDESDTYSGRILEKGNWEKQTQNCFKTTMTVSVEAVS